MSNEELLIWGLGLLAAGLLLIIVEVFIPSGGLISLAATGCAIAGIVFLFRVSVAWGITGIAVILVLGPMMFFFALRILPNTPIGRSMLGEKPPEQAEEERLAALKERERQLSMIGSEGVVLSDLRPVGIVQVGPDRIDALSETGLIRAGTRVRITAFESNQFKVRAV